MNSEQRARIIWSLLEANLGGICCFGDETSYKEIEKLREEQIAIIHSQIGD